MARILVIDDDELLRRFVVALLERRDYSVQSTDSGETGIKLAAENDFDLIITDIVMPGTEGLETIKQIRRNKPDIKILAVSAAAAARATTCTMPRSWGPTPPSPSRSSPWSSSISSPG